MKKSAFFVYQKTKSALTKSQAQKYERGIQPLTYQFEHDLYLGTLQTFTTAPITSVNLIY